MYQTGRSTVILQLLLPGGRCHILSSHTSYPETRYICTLSLDNLCVYLMSLDNLCDCSEYDNGHQEVAVGVYFLCIGFLFVGCSQLHWLSLDNRCEFFCLHSPEFGVSYLQ